MRLFLSELLLLVHWSTLFCQNFEGQKGNITERKHEIERHLLSTCPHFQIRIYMRLKLFFSEFSLLVHWSTLFIRILKDKKKRWSRKTASFTQFTLLDDEISDIIFFRILITLRSLLKKLA